MANCSTRNMLGSEFRVVSFYVPRRTYLLFLSNVSNVLFVDHPAQVGFSYANPVPGYVDANTGNIITLPNATCPEYALDMGSCGTYSSPNVSNTANTTEGAAPSMWKTLQGFMGAFPQYSANGVHFATESYGGHYGPIFNE
jgi:hypothetical protein